MIDVIRDNIENFHCSPSKRQSAHIGKIQHILDFGYDLTKLSAKIIGVVMHPKFLKKCIITCCGYVVIFYYWWRVRLTSLWLFLVMMQKHNRVCEKFGNDKKYSDES